MTSVKSQTVSLSTTVKSKDRCFNGLVLLYRDGQEIDAYYYSSRTLRKKKIESWASRIKKIEAKHEYELVIKPDQK